MYKLGQIIYSKSVRPFAYCVWNRLSVFIMFMLLLLIMNHFLIWSFLSTLFFFVWVSCVLTAGIFNSFTVRQIRVDGWRRDTGQKQLKPKNEVLMLSYPIWGWILLASCSWSHTLWVLSCVSKRREFKAVPDSAWRWPPFIPAVMLQWW